MRLSAIVGYFSVRISLFKTRILDLKGGFLCQNPGVYGFVSTSSFWICVLRLR